MTNACRGVDRSPDPIDDAHRHSLRLVEIVHPLYINTVTKFAIGTLNRQDTDRVRPLLNREVMAHVEHCVDKMAGQLLACGVSQQELVRWRQRRPDA